jgi:hypothetical protein
MTPRRPSPHDRIRVRLLPLPRRLRLLRQRARANFNAVLMEDVTHRPAIGISKSRSITE